MTAFRVHNVRFYKIEPNAIHCLAYEKKRGRLALARADNSIEIWDIRSSFYQEKVLHGVKNRSVEAISWCGRRLFSAGLNADIIEYDLLELKPKSTVRGSHGAYWCLKSGNCSKVLAAGTEEGYICLYDVDEEGLKFQKILDKQEGRTLSLAWDPTDEHIVTGSIDFICVFGVRDGHRQMKIDVGRQRMNARTVVWAVEVTSDFHIISGDSRGMVSFWNAHNGTLIESFHSHKADVVCLAVEEGEECVYASGVDPSISAFKKIQNPTNSQFWVSTIQRKIHTHDVRAMVMVGSTLISGGIDCMLTMSRYPPKVVQQFPPIPHRSLVSFAPAYSYMLLQYPNSLKYWQLGQTSQTSKEDGVMLWPKRKPQLECEVICKNEESIIASSLSPDGTFMAYSTIKKLRLFYITYTSSQHVASIMRLPNPPHTLPAMNIAFLLSPYCFVTLTKNGMVQFIRCHSSQPVLDYTLLLTKKNKQFADWHLLATSGYEFIAVGNHSGRIKVYSVQNMEQPHCSLPKYTCQPTALAFDPHSKNLFVVYTDHKLVEYDVLRCEYTSFSRILDQFLPSPWKRQLNAILGIQFDPKNPYAVILFDHCNICIINKNKIEKYDTWDAVDIRSVQICEKYKYLVHFGCLVDDMVVAVEVSPQSIMEKLPPLLKLKKYGT